MDKTQLDLVRGTLDVLILKALMWGPLHGYAITDLIRRQSDDALIVEEGTLYPALWRLESKGLLESEWGLAENNRKAKFYTMTAAVDATHVLAEAAALVPKGIVCLISALQFHGLTLQMPSAVWMAIERTAWKPTLSYPSVRFVRFSGWAMTEGVERYPVQSRKVSITNPARTIVDCFRYRNKIGIDIATEGLREGIRHR